MLVHIIQIAGARDGREIGKADRVISLSASPNCLYPMATASAASGVSHQPNSDVKSNTKACPLGHNLVGGLGTYIKQPQAPICISPVRRVRRHSRLPQCPYSTAESEWSELAKAARPLAAAAAAVAAAAAAI